MNDPQTDLQTVLNAISDPRRRLALAIIWGDGQEHCVCELMHRLQTSQPNTSRHMKALRDAGLLVDRRDAQWVRYRRNTALDPALTAVVKAVLDCEPPEAEDTRSKAA